MSELSDDVNNALAEAAFPLVINNNHSIQVAPGLQKRELFAALAMQGLLAWGPDQVGVYENETPSQAIARNAVNQADALIAALGATSSESDKRDNSERDE